MQCDESSANLLNANNIFTYLAILALYILHNKYRIILTVLYTPVMKIEYMVALIYFRTTL